MALPPGNFRLLIERRDGPTSPLALDNKYPSSSLDVRDEYYPYSPETPTGKICLLTQSALLRIAMVFF